MKTTQFIVCTKKRGIRSSWRIRKGMCICTKFKDSFLKDNKDIFENEFIDFLYNIENVRKFVFESYVRKSVDNKFVRYFSEYVYVLILFAVMQIKLIKFKKKYQIKLRCKYRRQDFSKKNFTRPILLTQKTQKWIRKGFLKNI